MFDCRAEPRPATDPARQIRGVLFDLDGTLLDTLEDIAHATNRSLAAGGFPTHEVRAYRRFVGDGVRSLIRRALPEDQRDEGTITACLASFLDDYGRTWNVATRPYPGIPEALEALVARGLKLAILSNKPDELTCLCVRDLLPRWRFDEVRGQRDGVPRKPDPASALEISRALDLRPDEFLFVGDSPVDMETAVAAGMVPVGVLWGFRSEDELRTAGAWALLHHPMGLIDLLVRKPDAHRLVTRPSPRTGP
ncbi:MAG: HAD family hydrolase [Candidatus Eisenbacteria bacterium]|nr:HAD family hydrolase [Candidatus Eisenbacteria bacterium]